MNQCCSRTGQKNCNGKVIYATTCKNIDDTNHLSEHSKIGGRTGDRDKRLGDRMVVHTNCSDEKEGLGITTLVKRTRGVKFEDRAEKNHQRDRKVVFDTLRDIMADMSKKH